MNVFRSKKSAPLSPIEYYRNLPFPSEGKSMRHLRGNIRTDCLLIGPVPKDSEYNAQVPFSNEDAQAMHGILCQYSFDTDRDALVIPCVAWGDRPRKENTEPIRALIDRYAKEKQFKWYLSVGDDAFKHIFGRGKKASMRAMAGQVLWLPVLNGVPLFVLPDPIGLTFNAATPRDERWKWERVQSEKIRWFHRLGAQLEKFRYGID